MPPLSSRLLFWLAIHFLRFSTRQHDFHGVQAEKAPPIECDLYFAESTLPNAGMGIFSGIERKVGERVGEGDICIPILELHLYHGQVELADEHSSAPVPGNPFTDYVWAGEVMGMRMEVDSEDIDAYCPGLDCAINCNLALINVGKADPIYDDAGLHRSRDPGAGAMTPYRNGTTMVTRNIPPGGELFKFYGDKWFQGRPEFQGFPLTDDFEKAQLLLEKYKNKFRYLNDYFKKVVYEDAIIQILQSTWNTSRTINALPRTYLEAMLAIKHDIGATHQPNATRSLEWLQTNGKCVDHIVPAPSNIPGAGHGAFAKRNLPKDTVITTSPLHHIAFKDSFMEMHDYSSLFGKLSQREVIGQQLLLNYCFSHDETTLAFCPYGLGVNYINHNKTLANVKLAWPQFGPFSQDDSWYFKSPTEFLQDTSAHLALDYVATRDIQAGEELYMDYGDAWDQAWEQHSSNWKPEHEWFESYLSAKDWNEMFGEIPLRTETEVLYDPYPATLHTRCHSDLVNRKKAWRRKKFQWDWAISEYGYVCQILNRTTIQQEGGYYSYSYHVEITTEKLMRWHDVLESQTLYFEGVPRQAIRFFDVPGTSDLHLSTAFRHAIGLPEELMQDFWKNLRKTRRHPSTTTTAATSVRTGEENKNTSTNKGHGLPNQPGAEL